jgi:prepilin-type processing-associated H-X9-DG protein
MPVSYIDIDGAGASGTLVRNGAGFRTPGALALKSYGGTSTGGDFTGLNGDEGPNVGEILDGLAHTIFLTEDVGRSETYFTPKYNDYGDPTTLVANNPTKRNAWRWAEPDTANGVSGPPNGKFGDPGLQVINNSNTPFGGPSSCPWTVNNCGPNDEAWSFHGNGCNCLFGDGHVTWVRADIDPISFRRLCTPTEGLSPAYSDY